MIINTNEPKIVVIGGGTGISVLLRGLKKYTSNLTAIVTVSDDGGNSGRLRAELGVLPPGDIRNCLVALAETETLMDKVFQHRFIQESSLKGHNLGNLLLVAMTEITGDFNLAIREVSKILAVKGRVIPATLEQVVLGAKMHDGNTIYGETLLREYKGKIEKLFLVPETCSPLPETIAALDEADAIIIGPGSLYTSIIPNLLVKGIKEGIAKSNATTFYVSNIMTELGETDNYTATDHLNVIFDYLDEKIIDYIVVNSGAIDNPRLMRYEKEQAIPVIVDNDKILQMGVKIIETDLVLKNDVAWHDSDKLALTIMKALAESHN
ncbi:MAG TPA: gluconeogenesis factor YvcK family protein [Syntrophomonadaceae bacterium]|nr:gluconeogenesis factor YvcK family protein [Syntrophomonadaceae bacterium]